MPEGDDLYERCAATRTHVCVIALSGCRAAVLQQGAEDDQLRAGN